MECLQDILPLLFLQHCVLIPNIDTLLLLFSPCTRDYRTHNIYISQNFRIFSSQVLTMIIIYKVVY